MPGFGARSQRPGRPEARRGGLLLTLEDPLGLGDRLLGLYPRGCGDFVGDELRVRQQLFRRSFGRIGDQTGLLSRVLDQSLSFFAGLGEPRERLGGLLLRQ